MAAECSEQGANSRLLSVSKIPSSLFEKESKKRGRNICKIVHKMIILVAETKEHLQFFFIGRRSPLLNCCNFLRIRLNSVT